MHRYITALAAFILIFTLVGVGYLTNYYYNVPLQTEKTIIIPKQAKIKDITALLLKDNIIPEAFSFKLLSYINMKQGKFLQSGEYYFPSGANIMQVFNKISSGERVVRKVTIPEGYTNYQIFALLNGTQGLDGEITTELLDGKLLPETYTFYYGDTRQSLLNQMQLAQTQFIEKHYTASYFTSSTDAIVLASIVEKEARINEERPIIASVYLNRLKIGMPLQADPTVIYALANGKTDFNYILSRADLTFDSPYNTYKYGGLPPSPICNPGKASIIATLNPATTPYLFFVADGTSGRHLFSKDYKEHLGMIKRVKQAS
ncbi:MAG: endolytic transglycosylase MltG [Rickettsiales bacterium]